MHEIKHIKHRDFYNSRKIDNYINLEYGICAKDLINFIKEKLKVKS